MLFAVNLFEQLPPLYLYGMAFVYGAFVGSFLNVCIIRIPLEGMSVFSPARSICFGCNQQIAWYDNIPILSYLWLRGRCRCEKYSISLQYPLVELMTAVMAVAVVRRFGPRWESLVIFAFVCVLIVITFIDLAYWIIPDVLSLPTIPLAIGAAALFGPPLLPTWQDAALGAALGGGSLLVIHLFYEWVLRRTGLGLGDVKLLALIGAFVGWKNTLTVVFLASVQGVVVAIFLYLLGWREQVPEDWDEQAPSPLSPPPTETSETSQAALSTETSETSQTALSTETSQTSQTALSTETSEASQTAPSTETSEASQAALSTETSETSQAAPSTETSETPQVEEAQKDIGWGRVAIPFGPFLALGAFEVIFWGERIVAWWMETIRRIFLFY
ncbi:prepilin peptidase [Myxococcota bacterium]|nr:prepilin peptidase [Myxococcota bacterium]